MHGKPTSFALLVTLRGHPAQDGSLGIKPWEKFQGPALGYSFGDSSGDSSRDSSGGTALGDSSGAIDLGTHLETASKGQL